MAPKIKVTRQKILEAGVELVRREGETALNARTLATMIGCSTQPIFTHFSSMEQLRLALVEEAEKLCGAFIEQEVASGKYPSYKASGMAYIRFAAQERNLFRLLYMRDRTNETEAVGGKLWNVGVEFARQYTQADADWLHMKMWVLVHGFATMAATGFLELDEEKVSQMVTDVFQGLKTQMTKE